MPTANCTGNPTAARLRLWLQCAGLAIAYAVAGRLGQLVAIPPGNVTAVWLPSGIALAAVLRSGRQVWPGIWLGSLAANVWLLLPGPTPMATAMGAAVSVAIACGSTTQALAGAWLMRHLLDGPPLLTRIRHVATFGILAGIACCIAATVGAVSLWFAGYIPRAAVPWTWATWWLGDLFGIITVVPLVTEADPRLRQWPVSRSVEASALVLLKVGLGLLVFGVGGAAISRYPLTYLLLPLLTWSALRFGHRGVVVDVLTCGVMAFWATLHGIGPFAIGTSHQALFMLQTFMGVALLTGFVLAAAFLERRDSEAALRSSRDQLAVIFQGVADGITVQAPSGKLLYANAEAARMIGFDSVDALLRTPPEEIIRRFVIMDEAGRPFSPGQLPGRRALQGELAPEAVLRFRRHDTNEERWSLVKASAIRDDDGQVRFAVNIFHDITERRLAQSALEASEARFRALVEQAPVPMMLFAPDGAPRLVNRAWERFYDTNLAQLAGYNVLQDPQLTKNGVIDQVRRAFAGEAVAIPPIAEEPSQTGRAGYPRWIEACFYPAMGPDGRVAEVVAMVRDVTDQKLAGERLLSSLREKEVLLKEIHHRVKNNLQVVSSLLSLQAEAVDEPKLLELVEESQHRIRSMALVHEKLYGSRNLSSIDMAAYIRSLGTQLLQSYLPEGGITLTVQVDGITLGIDQAIPCGLLLNELISNALKHAFPDGRAGSIVVALRDIERQTLSLTIEDDGVGMPGALDPLTTESLGLRLVRALVEQLGGHVRIEQGGGTRFIIEFPAPRPSLVVPLTAPTTAVPS